MKISMALDKIDEHQLFIPMFQREYVWKRDDAKLLIDSLIKEYPIGTILTWHTNRPPKIKGRIKYSKKQGSVFILLDGQQRLTTLYMLIRGEIPPYYTEQEVTNDIRGLYVNIKTLELEYPSNKVEVENDLLWHNITKIFMKDIRTLDIVRNLQAKGEEVSRELEDKLDDNIRAIDSISERDFLEQAIPPKATVREAIDVFYKVNASGVTLTDTELALAQISRYWPEARDIFKQKIEKLENKGFVLNIKFILCTLLGCLYHQGSDLKKLHADDNNRRLRNAWKLLDDQVLDHVIDIMRNYAYVHHVNETSSIYALIPIIVFCYDMQKKRKRFLNNKEIQKLVRWFYYSQIGLAYQYRLKDDLDRDLKIIDTSQTPLDELLGEINFWGDIAPSSLTGAVRSRMIARLMLWYFRSRGACCLQSGKKLLENTSKERSIQFHPIFPAPQLEAEGYSNKIDLFGDGPWVGELGNVAILAKDAGKRGKKNAKHYLTAFSNKHPDALALQSIPEDKELWEGRNFEKFLKVRREILANGLNSFLKGIVDSPRQEIAVEELIKKGEGSTLEFKSSLRWDIEESKVNKDIENAVVKVVASFSNTSGGLLLIGVNDEGAVLGLDHDYRSFRGDKNRGDKDQFERHLRSILRSRLNIKFIATNTKICFREVSGHEICQLEVQKSHKPVIISQKDKHGQSQEKFYIRNGNLSEALSFQEMSDYILENF